MLPPLTMLSRNAHSIQVTLTGPVGPPDPTTSFHTTERIWVMRPNHIGIRKGLGHPKRSLGIALSIRRLASKSLVARQTRVLHLSHGDHEESRCSENHEGSQQQYYSKEPGLGAPAPLVSLLRHYRRSARIIMGSVAGGGVLTTGDILLAANQLDTRVGEVELTGISSLR